MIEDCASKKPNIISRIVGTDIVDNIIFTEGYALNEMLALAAVDDPYPIVTTQAML